MPVRFLSGRLRLVVRLYFNPEVAVPVEGASRRLDAGLAGSAPPRPRSFFPPLDRAHRRGRSSRGERREKVGRNKHRHFLPNQFGGKRRQVSVLAVRIAKFDRDVLSDHVARFLKPLRKAGRNDASDFDERLLK